MLRGSLLLPAEYVVPAGCGCGDGRRWLPKREGTTKWEDLYFQQVPNYKVGKRVYFSKKAINKWIRLHMKKDYVECFKGLTEKDLKVYPVGPEQQQDA